MKQTLLLLSMLLSFTGGYTQLVKKPAPANNFSDSLQKIILAYKNNFQSIQGSKLPPETEAVAFRSRACLPGASNCKILRYNSTEDQSASWQCTLYKGDNQEEAVKLYKKTFEQLKKIKIRGIDPAGNSFFGELDPPEGSLRFYASSLRIKTANKVYINFVANVELLSNYTGWVVQLNIYSQAPIAAEEADDESE